MTIDELVSQLLDLKYQCDTGVTEVGIIDANVDTFGVEGAQYDPDVRCAWLTVSAE